MSVLSSASSNEKTIKSFEAIIRDCYQKDDRTRLDELARVNKELQTLQTRLKNAQTLMLDGALDASEYKGIKAEIEPKIGDLNYRRADLSVGSKDEEELIDFGFKFLRNVAEWFASADLEEKRHIMGSTFPDRLIFENGKCRTPEKDNILLLIATPGAGFSEKRKSGKDESFPLSRWVEPGRGKSNFFVEDLRVIETLLTLS